MKKKKPDRIIIIVCILFAVIPGYSQGNFAYKATLGEIEETKFYKIDLPPALVAKCKPALEDIRIFDEDGKEVSYILKNDLPAFKREYLTEFPIIENRKEKDKQTHILLQNTTGKSVSSLLLFIRNTDAQRSFSVSGSDDSLHWFIIKENISLANAFNNDGQNIIQTLSFPPGNYKYFQLTILGENLLPFNIVKAGVYDEDVVYGKYVKIPGPGLSQTDSSNKKSYVRLDFDDKYKIDKIDFEVEGAKYFRRRFSLLEGEKANDALLLDDYLSSDSANSYSLNCKNSHFLAIIDNEDNIPLKVKSVTAYQLNTWLLTYLQSGKKYLLSFGDSIVRAPHYDLNFFSNTIEKDPAGMLLSNIEKNRTLLTGSKPSGSKNSHAGLWTIMILIFLSLCLFTFKMLKEVNKKVDGNQ